MASSTPILSKTIPRRAGSTIVSRCWLVASRSRLDAWTAWSRAARARATAKSAVKSATSRRIRRFARRALTGSPPGALEPQVRRLDGLDEPEPPAGGCFHPPHRGGSRELRLDRRVLRADLHDLGLEPPPLHAH